MASRKMQITFSEENEDLYLYLKKYRYPSEIVCKALRAYQSLNLKSNTNDVLHDTIKQHVLDKDVIDSIVQTLKENNVLIQSSSQTEEPIDTTDNNDVYDALLAASATQFELD